MATLNGVMMQYFHWYSPGDGQLWNQVKANAKDLADAGFTAMWLPPAYQELDESDNVGDGVYDMLDRGEVNLKGSVRTKYGTCQDYLNAIAALQGSGIHVYADAGLNLLIGSTHDGQDEGVRAVVTDWGKGYLDTTGVDGFRFAAVNDGSGFLSEWIHALKQHAQRDLFMMGDYGDNDLERLLGDIDAVQGKLSVLDVPLHVNFHHASRAGEHYNMASILNGTVMQTRPTHAVTFVENHNSQPLQALESVVEPWFKPLAYALILLRQEGYPCVFYADYYGANYSDRGYDIDMPSHRFLIDRFLDARQAYAYGPQYDYFDHGNTVGWTCLGDKAHPKAMAVLMSNGAFGTKWMDVGKPNVKLIDITEHIKDPVYTNDWGWAEFFCNGRSVSVWVEAYRT